MFTIKFYFFISLLVFYVIKNGFAQLNNQEWPPGWTEKCISCICEASTGCNQTIGCIDEYCGMFLISRPYWVDAGSPVLLGDDKNSPEAFYRCTSDSYCSSRTVNQYVQRFIQDCNNDGFLSCDDYTRLHYFGYVQCTQDISRTTYYQFFQTCFKRN